MAIKIYSYNNGEGSRLLAAALGVKRLKHQGSRYVPRRGDYIINWGCTAVPFVGATIVNPPAKVASVSNKLTFFSIYNHSVQQNDQAVKPLFNVPPYFFDQDTARQWLWEGEGRRTLVARTIINGHEGRGIVLCDNPLDIPRAPLYTGYVKKKKEYRVHVMSGRVIDEVEKKRRRDYQGDRDARIRNTANGYVFARTDVVVPACVREAAVNAVSFYGLDFGAVDIIWNEYENRAYVLETNTAPGIEGTTVQRYAETFKEWLV